MEKKSIFDSFSISFNFTTTDKEQTYKGVEAYKYLEELIEFDKDYSNTKKELGYNPANRSIFLKIDLKGYFTKKTRFDLGDEEFGGFLKVSDALEYRFKRFPEGLIEHKNFYAKNLEKTPEEIDMKAKEMLEEVDKVIRNFRKDEQIYLTEREKVNPFKSKLGNEKKDRGLER